MIEGDVDADGKDEIVYGAMVVDDDGTGLYSTGLGHGDAQHISDLDPSRPGMEIWSIHENPAARAGVELRNARTGEIYFAAAYGVDVGRGMAADIDPRHPGYEMWGGTRNLFNTKGEDIGPRPSSQNMIPTQFRMLTLMHDSQYRLSITWQNVGYNQPPHPSFFLGHGKSKP